MSAVPEARRLNLIIVLISLILMSAVAVSTVYAEIRLQFSDSPGWMLDFMTVAPNLMNLIAMAISGFFLTKLPLKAVSLSALTLILMGGILPLTGLGGLAVIILSRCFVGLGCGVLSPAITLLAAGFSDQRSRDRALGWRAAAQALGSMTMMLMTIFLARLGWRWAFAVNLTALPVLIAMIHLIPGQFRTEDKRQTEKETVQEEAEENPSSFWPQVIFYSIMAFFYMVCLNTLAPNLSALIVEAGIGAGTLSGFAMMVYMLGGFLCGLWYSRITSFCGRYTLLLGVVITAAGIGAVAAARDMSLIFLGCGLQGIGYSIYSSAGVTDVSRGLSGAAKSRAILSVMIGIGIGSFTSPFITGALAEWVPGRANMGGRYVVGAVLLTVCGVVLFVHDRMIARRKG